MMPIYDDQSGKYTTGLLGIPVLLVLLVLIILTFPSVSARFATAGVGGGLILLYLIYLVVQYTRWRQKNRRRQAAVSGDHSLVFLPSTIPGADMQALPLPYSLHLKVNWRALLVWIVSYFCIYLVLGFLTSLGGSSRSDENDPITTIFILVFVPLLIIARFLYERPLIGVTANVLVIDSAMLRWSDARLFAVRGRGKPGEPARQFELSNGQEVLVWQYLHPHPWWSSYIPPVPLLEYEQQMARLLDCIAAQTNLPLYDVR